MKIGTDVAASEFYSLEPNGLCFFCCCCWVGLCRGSALFSCSFRGGLWEIVIAIILGYTVQVLCITN